MTDDLLRFWFTDVQNIARATIGMWADISRAQTRALEALSQSPLHLTGERTAHATSTRHVSRRMAALSLRIVEGGQR